MKTATTYHLDNLATANHPVWRRRIRLPLTPWAVRCDLIAQSAEVPEHERVAYVSRRLTALDRRLSDTEAQALEEWLLCHELLNGAAKIPSYGDRSYSGGRGSSPIPDRMMARVGQHMEICKHTPIIHRRILDMLAVMMTSRDWDYGEAGYALFGRYLSYHQAKQRFIRAAKNAACYLLNPYEIA